MTGWLKSVYFAKRHYLFVALSALLVLITENFESFYGFLGLFALFPAIYALRSSKSVSLAILFAVLHTGALFTFLWFSYPIDWMNIRLHPFHQVFLIAFLHLSYILFLSPAFFVWARLVQNEKNLRLFSLLKLSFVYVLSAITSSFLFSVLMYSPSNNNFDALFSLHYFSYSLADNILLIQYAKFASVFSLMFFAVFANFLIFKILEKEKNKKEYALIFLFLTLLIPSFLFPANFTGNLVNKINQDNMKILLVKSDIKFHKLKKDELKKSLEQLKSEVESFLNKRGDLIFVLLPESVDIEVDMEQNKAKNNILIQGNYENFDLISGKLLNKIKLKTAQKEELRDKYYLAPFGEYMPSAYKYAWNFLSSILGFPEFDKVEYKTKKSNIKTYNWKNLYINPLLCSESLDAFVFLKISKHPGVISGTNSFSIFSSSYFDLKMIRIFKTISVASHKNFYFSSNSANIGLALKNGDLKLYKETSLLPLKK